ncbi:MAG: type I phosphomannose isomerase catalytic subunit [Kiritimatiellia bacterium]|jgi:mannose-6-phosphate isomerase
MNLRPLLFKPVYRDYVWGGDRIREQFDRAAAPSPCAESWEVSAHPDGMSVVEGGPCAGKTLADLCAEFGREILGSHSADGHFPILVKLIDAKTRLSVQVHPDEAAAERHGGEAKTEMWYILDAAPGAFVCAGLKPGIGPRHFDDAIRSGKVAATLRTLPVVPGRAVYIPGGLVHAIGDHCLILEVQQSSNTTYRVYDWDRVDHEGKPRPLHVKQAMEVIDWRAPELELIASIPMNAAAAGNKRDRVLRCDFFTMERFSLTVPEPFESDGASFRVLFAPDHDVAITWADGRETLPAGRSCLIPAAMPPYTLAPAGAAATVLAVEV